MRLIPGAAAFLALLLISAECRHGTRQQTPTNSSGTSEIIEGKYSIDSNRVTAYFNDPREKQEFKYPIYNFYKVRNFTTAWFDKGQLSTKADEFIGLLEHADNEGLNPQDYRSVEIESYKKGFTKGPADEEAISNADILLTTEFFRYAADLGEGRTRLSKADIGWFFGAGRGIKYDTVLTTVLADQSKDAFLKLEPPHTEYARLKILLKNYRQLDSKGGWHPITGISVLKIGDTSQKVVNLRERLAITGDLISSSANFFNPKIFDRTLELSVKAFQTRHGLEPDGIVKGETLNQLNVPVSDRIKQVIVNMERWRLVPPHFGSTYLLVNVPEFKLHVFDNGKEAFNMRVVVGKEYKSTPVFNDMLQYIVFSPYWNIPKSITEEEVLPLVEKDPAYLSRNHMEVVKGYSDKAVIVNPWEVPWYQLDEDNFQYRIRQRPGPDNPLGLVKFVFPNNHNVYLHDTPADHLFSKVRRDYSHGCIRIEQPLKLAEFLLRGKKEWDEAKILAAMNKGEEQYVNVPKTPVYILYFTTWVADDGKVEIRPDLYGQDVLIRSML